MYIFYAVALAVAIMLYGYSTLDRFGIASFQADATVTGKKFTPGPTTYNTNVVGGRPLVQSTQQSDFYAVSLQLNGEATGALVDKATFDALNAGDRVHVTAQRTRLSRQLLVTDVRR
jgi:hypothetical protein